ncbi:MAG: flavodoxin family protein [Ezakiella sp.]|nr:flavodoxin family protein [Ezakiella sp.]MDD7471669.1 flavodoxin family protein [Bacillota bacterium]MDY3923453.1 flavodoxin family protein [Ezakiella sp.]
MRKIFIYLPLRKSESRIYNQINILNSYLTANNDVEIVYRTPKNSKIKICTGCQHCFKKGICILDGSSDDDMREIKKEMLDSDFIVFTSPVYLHNVNADAKNFIDRIAYWTHILRMTGKNSMAISYADTNGANIVYDYLNKILNYLGCKTIKGECFSFGLLKAREVEDKSKALAQNILDVIYLKKETVYRQNQKLMFDMYKETAQNNGLNEYERRFWKFVSDRGIKNIEEFEYFLNEVKNETQIFKLG